MLILKEYFKKLLKQFIAKIIAYYDYFFVSIYNGKVSGKGGTGRPRLTFENTVSKILEEGHVK